MPSRDPKNLTDRMQKKLELFTKKMKEAKISFIITCTSRDVKEQYALWAQGRFTLSETNRLRKMANLPPITAAENKRKVTWTLNSKHLVNLDNKEKFDDKSQAFDIVITKDKKAIWDLKVDVNEDKIPDYIQAGEIGESCGLRWGGRFKSPDYSHFEDNGKNL